MRALFTGSFDPVTNGHLDLISRLAPLVDSLVVGVGVNPDKQPLFTDDERVAMLRTACAPWPQVTVQTFQGLAVEAARTLQADLLVRGVRPDEYAREVLMAQANRALSGVETLLLPADPALAFLSASVVREVARFGGDVSRWVPAPVAARLRARFAGVE